MSRVRTLIGLPLVLTGAFLAIIGLLGAIGTSLTLKVLPGRKVVDIAGLPADTGPDADTADPAARTDRVVVRGTVAAGPGGTYRAPLSDTECAWYLASQTVATGTERVTVDRYPPQPFVLRDPQGQTVLVGPDCPALEQIAPSFRETRTDPHPWFDEAPAAPGEIEVFEFVLTEGSDLLASGNLGPGADGTRALSGAVSLSAAGDAAAAGDPGRRTLRRDLALALAGLAMLGLGSLMLSTLDHGDYQDNERPSSPTQITPQ